MALIALASAKGSPGVTTAGLALAAAWPRPVLLAECDPAGGDLLTGYLNGQVASVGGLLELAVASRRGLSADDVLRHSLRLDEAARLCVLTGLQDAGQASALTGLWTPFATACRSLGEQGRDVLADCGRLTHDASGPVALMSAADRCLLVLRPSLTAVRHARSRLALLRRDIPGTDVALLLIGGGAYGPAEVSQALQAEVAGVLPDDPGAAAVLAGAAAPGRTFARSPLMRAARALAANLATTPVPAWARA